MSFNGFIDISVAWNTFTREKVSKGPPKKQQNNESHHQENFSSNKIVLGFYFDPWRKISLPLYNIHFDIKDNEVLPSATQISNYCMWTISKTAHKERALFSRQIWKFKKIFLMVFWNGPHESLYFLDDFLERTFLSVLISK